MADPAPRIHGIEPREAAPLTPDDWENINDCLLLAVNSVREMQVNRDRWEATRRKVANLDWFATSAPLLAAIRDFVGHVDLHRLRKGGDESYRRLLDAERAARGGDGLREAAVRALAANGEMGIALTEALVEVDRLRAVEAAAREAVARLEELAETSAFPFKPDWTAGSRASFALAAAKVRAALDAAGEGEP